MPAPLMPKATAVWLVENTSLTFDQIADFCGLHPLEVQAIADGEVAIQMQGLDPVANGQTTAEDIKPRHPVSLGLCTMEELDRAVARAQRARGQPERQEAGSEESEPVES